MFFQIRSIKSDVFAWLDQVQESLERGQSVPEVEEQKEAEIDEDSFFEQRGVPYRVTIQKMKDLIFDHISDFVDMDPVQTVKLCDQWFDGDYNSVARALKE